MRVNLPPIQAGWIRIVERRIVDVGQGTPPVGCQDMGDVAIMPRLVNTHTHLEFSGLESPLGEAGISLASWIQQVVACRQESSEASKRQAILSGLAEIWETGTILAGEITTPPCDYPEGPGIPQLVSFAEVLGLSDQRAADRLSAAESHLASSENGAVSPHAPYSLSRDTVEAAVQLAQSRGCPLAMHVAESPEERELLIHGTGPLVETLQSLGVWRPGLFTWGEQPFCRLIDTLALAQSALIIHGNHFADGELDRLAIHRNLTVVYCPRTHHFFRYDRHPVDRMIARGIRVALGTDSRASNPDLNLWRELQFLLRHRSDLDPSDVLRMATWNGAVALKQSTKGVIEAGASSDLGYVRTESTTLAQLYEDLSQRDYEVIDYID